MAELKPCPFCGSEDLKIYSNAFENYYVVCLGCGASGRNYRSVEKAKEVWNRRAYICAVCGVKITEGGE